jgi:hypothetical protein
MRISGASSARLRRARGAPRDRTRDGALARGKRQKTRDSEGDARLPVAPMHAAVRRFVRADPTLRSGKFEFTGCGEDDSAAAGRLARSNQ